LKLKCTKFDFGRGSAPYPAGGAYRIPPHPLAGFQGPISKGKREKRKVGEARGKPRRNREPTSKRRGGKGK